MRALATPHPSLPGAPKPSEGEHPFRVRFDELAIGKTFDTASRTITLYPTNYTNGTAVLPFTVGSDASCTGADGCAWSWQRRAMMLGGTAHTTCQLSAWAAALRICGSRAL